MSLFKEVMQTFSHTSEPSRQGWSFDAKSPILAPPLVYTAGKNLHIVLATKDGRVMLVSGEGKLEWEFGVKRALSKVDRMFIDEDNAKSISATPAMLVTQEPLIVFGSEAGTIQALTLDGKKAWELATKGPVRTSPLIADINGDGAPEIIVTCMDRLVYALSQQGKVLWTFTADAEIESSPTFAAIAAGNSIFFGTNSGTLYCISNEGKERWNFKIQAPITAQPVCGHVSGTAETYVAFGGHDNRMYVLNERGIKEWDFRTGGKILSPAVLADINTDSRLEVCVGSTDDSVYMLSPSGGMIWQFETNFWIAAPPLIADFNGDGKLEVAVGSYDKTLYLLSAEGAYHLQTMPGLTNVTQDFSNVSGLMSAAPGATLGKELWRHKAQGMITGVCKLTPTALLVSTANGKIEAVNL